MSALEITVYLFGAMSATSCAYALVMSLLQRKINMLWTRGEAVFGLMSFGIALSFGFSMLGASLLHTFALLLLVLGLIMCLGIVIFHRFFMKESEYSEGELKHMKVAGIALLSVSMLQILALFGAFSGV